MTEVLPDFHETSAGRNEHACAREDESSLPPNSSPDFIFVSLENWDEIWRRNQFLCAQFVRTNPARKMLFVGLARDVSNCIRTGKWSEIFRPISSTLPDFPSIATLQPLKLLPNSFAATRLLNEFFTRWQVKRATRRLGLVSPLLWLNPHFAMHMAGRMGESAVIYDVTDDWLEATSGNREGKLMRKQDEELCRRADAVIVCSERLQQLKQKIARRLFLIPNGVDATHYQHVLDGTNPLPDQAAEWSQPVIGYTGTIHPERVDLPLVRELARRLPEATFALIGPLMISGAERNELAALPNIKLVGPIPYGGVPEYMRAFAVCIVPHLVTPFTESLNPIKLWEYLAAGKPIVSSKVAGFRDYPQWVRLANGADEFVREIQKALKEDPGVGEARRAEARRHSWATRWRQVETVIQQCLTTA